MSWIGGVAKDLGEPQVLGALGGAAVIAGEKKRRRRKRMNPFSEVSRRSRHGRRHEYARGHRRPYHRGGSATRRLAGPSPASSGAIALLLPVLVAVVGHQGIGHHRP